MNHSFIDGNKRTGYVILRLLLLQNNIDLTANENEKYNFVINVASGQIKYDDIVIWLENNTKRIQ